MNKGVIIRASIILGIFVAIILVAVGIEAFTTNEATPSLSNPDDVYLTVDGLEVTNQELWNTMKNTDGLDYLSDYILEYLLSDEMDAVTQEEIDAEIQLLTYLTENEEVIAEIQANEEMHQDYLDAFRQNVIVMGYDPEDPEDLADFVRLSIAKRNYTEQFINEATEDDTYYVSDEEVEEYYDSVTYGDVCSIELRFSSAAEIETVFKEFNLVLNYNLGIGEYIGTDPIDTILIGEFDDTNTIQLEDDAVFPFYVKIYNYMNPWADQLPENITQEEFCTNYADIAVKNYDDMTQYKSEGYPEYDLAQYLFVTLDLEDEDTIPYTYTTTKTFSDYVMMTFKVSQEDTPAYLDLSDAERALVREEYIETLATDTAISTITDNLIDDNNFELFDPLFKLVYAFQTGEEFDNKGSETVLASIDGLEVTADDLFEYMENRLGTFYVLEALKYDQLLNSDAYTEKFGDATDDYFSSDNEEIVAYVDQLEEMKALFGTNYYEQYGYSSADMTWDEFMFLAFGLEDENDVIENMFIIPDLQNEYMFDMINYEDGVAYMQDQIDSYYSLDVSHILIYLDYDFDFAPDDFTEYREGLTGDAEAEMDQLLLDFQDLIKSKIIDDEFTMAQVVEEYTETLISDDDSEWAPFKQYGFFMKTEDLGEIDHISGLTLDEGFSASLKRIYDNYVNDDELDVYNDTQLTFTTFGVHYISATQGTAFEQYSAEYEDTTESGDPENDGILPTQEQVELYLEIKYAETTNSNTLVSFDDSDVYDAVDYYFSTIYDSYMSQTAFGAALGQYVLDNNGEFADNNAEKLAELQDLVTALNEVNYPELFGQTVE
jgi:hypothetical protein